MKKKRKKRNRSGRMGKGVYILPNLFTTASMFAGFYSIVSTLNHRFTAAAVAIVISAIMDGLDGKVARMTNTTSQFGVEYDSLADLLAFGMAPGILAYVWALQPFGRLGWVVAFLYVTCGALRLARFNVYAGVKSSEFFQGLAIPAAGCTISATVLWFGFWGHSDTIKNGGVLFLIFVLSFLMVSNFKYFSLKNPELFKRKPFNTLVVTVLLFSLVAIQPRITLFIVAMSYMVSGPVYTFYERRQRIKLGLPEEQPLDADLVEPEESQV